MPTYILLTKLAPDIATQVSNRSQLGGRWLEEIKKICPEVKFISHYALLGQYDFMDIYEAPNEEIAAKVSLICQQNGAMQSQSMTAIPYNRFLELSKEI